MYAVVDCDNCYVSCERVFRPELKGKPVVVLSNNDGCVVARSNEAKQMGIKAGMPYFELLQQYPGGEIAAFSSNYELYGELTGRVMQIISEVSPAYFRYSIDEAFCMLDGIPNDHLKRWGEALYARVMKSVGVPVSVGIAPTKTLAKLASHYAKHYKGYRHCCVIDSDEKRVKALKLSPIDEVWGVGHRYARRLMACGDRTAYDLSVHHKEWIMSNFNVVLARTCMELQGIDCIANEEPTRKKSICTSRSFNGMIGDIATLRTHVANFASRCAEKLRSQGSVASTVALMLQTNHFREDLPQDDNFMEITLPTPSDSTQTIVHASTELLKAVYKVGYQYKRAGVIVSAQAKSNGYQTSFIDFDAERFEKLRRLDKTIDLINRLNGSETVVIGSQQSTSPGGQGKAGTFGEAMRREMKSKNPTTRWSDIIVLK